MSASSADAASPRCRMDARLPFIKLAECLKVETVAKATANTLHPLRLDTGWAGWMRTEDVQTLGYRKSLQGLQGLLCRPEHTQKSFLLVNM